ncbi:MAG: hypothetical protein J7L59_02135 [Nanoarchaeota archaeon]|nr:hypothetical protein [Nanoarchaeota archaeon]
MEFWSEWVIDKSFSLLKELRRKIDFILIGGWAVYFLTGALKSKDINLIVDFENLARLRNLMSLSKTDFLRKYQARVEGVDVDIYVIHYSRFIIPTEEIVENTMRVKGFVLPTPEILLILKQEAEKSRRDSMKGQKDRTDILALLASGKVDMGKYEKLLKRYGITSFKKRLLEIIRNSRKEYEYLGARNPKEVKKLKGKLLEMVRKGGG